MTDASKSKTGAQTGLSPLKRAYLQIEKMQQRVAELEQGMAPSIAVVGLGCRFPGGVDSPDSYWQMLHDGVDAIKEIPNARFNLDPYFDSDPEAVGKTYCRHGGFLDRVQDFDPEFFGISPREAAAMDPQHRLLMEVTWEALEHSGQSPKSLGGTPAGVFMAVCSSDYSHLHIKNRDASCLGTYFPQGTAHNGAAGRISYCLGLRGPSMAIDTACSSSLVAVHLACQSLRAKECSQAIAGGVNLILSHELLVAFSSMRILGRGTRCPVFDAASDGTYLSEGCGVVVLKRLDDAQRDGNRILAIIRGSAVNQDGASSSLTAPNGFSQQEVIRAALAQAQVKPAEISYVETHGTGTELGDPIEVDALANVLGGGRSEDNPLWIGSVKTNMGHTAAAAGIAGFIKCVLSLEHREIPPHLHFESPSPHIEWEKMQISVPTKPTPWPDCPGERFASVSSFGIVGTNAHVVLQSAPIRNDDQRQERTTNVLTLSGRSDAALTEMANRLSDCIAAQPSASLADICYTTNVGRAHFEHRAASLVKNSEDALAKLDRIIHLDHSVEDRTFSGRHGKKIKVAFLFTGQGAQYANMGKRLYETQPVYRKALDECSKLFDTHLDVPMSELLFPQEENSSRLDQTKYTQPALFALEYSLAKVWEAWGVVPSTVLGHSIGEYVAACIAKVLSLEDAVSLVATRARLMDEMPGDGLMAAIFAPLSTAQEAIASFDQTVSIAAVNSPLCTVISGHREDVQRVVNELRQQGTQAEELNTSHAFHSSLMSPLQDEFLSVTSSIEHREPEIAIISSLHGTLADQATFNESTYWYEHLRNPVQFLKSVETLLHREPDTILEVGPHPVLLSLTKQISTEKIPTCIPSLRRGSDDESMMMEAVAKLYEAGADIEWQRVHEGYSYEVVTLPTYPFQRRAFWMATTEKTTPKPAAPSDRLGQRIESPALDGIIFQTSLDESEFDFIREHVVDEKAILPFSAYIDLALAAARAIIDNEEPALTDVVVQGKMTVARDDGQSHNVQTHLLPRGDARADFTCYGMSTSTSNQKNGKTLATGRISPANLGQAIVGSEDQLSRLQDLLVDEISISDLYEDFSGLGIQYGKQFRMLHRLWRRKGEALGEIRLRHQSPSSNNLVRIHPTALDACLQVMGAVFAEELDGSDANIFLPVGCERIQCSGNVTDIIWSHGRSLSVAGSDLLKGDVTVFNASGQIIAQLEGLLYKRAHRIAPQPQLESDWLYQRRWKCMPLQDETPAWKLAGLYDDLKSHADVLRKRFGVDEYDESLRNLDGSCTAFIVKAFVDLGIVFESGQSWDADSLRQRVGLVDQHVRLLERMLAILTEDGILQAVPSNDDEHVKSWRVMQVPSLLAVSQQISQWVNAEHGNLAPIAELVRDGGQQLAKVLVGEVDGLEILFPDGNLQRIERIYAESNSARCANSTVVEAIRLAMEQLDHRKEIRILEVGGGTGATTDAVLNSLPPDRVAYFFTDISTRFTSHARERFSAFPFVHYDTLDIENEPTQQGFSENNFDIVLASSVVHATRDLSSTLKHLQSLLKPNGLLILIEGTIPQRWVDITFGLVDGWWRFTDTELRPSYALLPQAEWLQLLEREGFEDAQAIPEQEAPEVVLLAQKQTTDEPEVLDEPKMSGGCIVLADQSDIALDVASVLSEEGVPCIQVFAGIEFKELEPGIFQVDVSNPEHFRQLLVDKTLAPCEELSVVHLWSLDSANNESITTQSLDIDLERNMASVLHLLQAVNDLERPIGVQLCLVTRGAQNVGNMQSHTAIAQSAIWGLGHVIRSEYPEISCALVDLDPEPNPEEASQICQCLHNLDAEEQIAFRKNDRYVNRIFRCKFDDSTSLSSLSNTQLQLTTPGDLDSLRFQPVPRQNPGAGEVEIQVHAVGLNFRDVLNGVGMRTDNVPLGSECAGRIVTVGEEVEGFQPGDEVIALAVGSFASHVIARSEFVIQKPKEFTFDEAAAVLSSYVSAYYGLKKLMTLPPHSRVLIHSAAGGLGLAAFQLAQQAGAEVFATAGSLEKRDYLRTLGIEYVMDSRSLDFADQVMQDTNNEGVDVVVSALTGDYVSKGISILRAGGSFLEYGESDVWSPLQVSAMRDDISYLPVDIEKVSREQPELIGEILDELAQAFSDGRLKPIPHQTFDQQDVAEAFRLLARRKNIGKAVVSIQIEDQIEDQIEEKSSESDFTCIGPLREFEFTADGTYLIVGGFGGLGLAVASWMVDQGARHVTLTGRSEPSQNVLEFVQQAREHAADVRLVRSDVTNSMELQQVLDQIEESMPPLRGVVHSAGTLDDGLLSRQSYEQFRDVLAPKIHGAWNLHDMTKDYTLDFFVLFSSTASFVARPGQGNHAAANTFLNALAQTRSLQGLPAISINWGPWAEIGAAAELGEEYEEQTSQLGVGLMPPDEALQILQQLLASSACEVDVLPVNWQQFRAQYKNQRLPALYADIVRNEPQRETTQPTPQNPTSENSEWIQRLRVARQRERNPLLREFVRTQIAKVLECESTDHLDDSRPLSEYGLDSLMAVELRNLLAVPLDLSDQVPGTLLFRYPTIAAIANFLAESTGNSSPESPDDLGSANAPTTPDDESDVASLTDDQVREFLADEIERAAELAPDTDAFLDDD